MSKFSLNITVQILFLTEDLKFLLYLLWPGNYTLEVSMDGKPKKLKLEIVVSTTTVLGVVLEITNVSNLILIEIKDTLR